jgi:hypothetical protein
MRERMSHSPLCEAPQFARDFLAVLRQAREAREGQSWCPLENLPGTPPIRAFADVYVCYNAPAEWSGVPARLLRGKLGATLFWIEAVDIREMPGRL